LTTFADKVDSFPKNVDGSYVNARKLSTLAEFRFVPPELPSSEPEFSPANAGFAT
jgi:hypothetical protein